MALQDYQITALGDKRIHHNQRVAHSNRKLSLESTASSTQLLLKLGYISTTVTATAYDDGTALTTYTVTAKGAGRILHGTGNPPPTSPLPQGATLQLDPVEELALQLLARGWIV